MALDADEEILQDFLVEAGEILEQLSEQLVELENNPDDQELLNAIFRGFHTVKGGAGFLQLDALVDCCHVAENVFDILRNGKRTVTSNLMDTVLATLDRVNTMFDEVRNREEPTPAESSLLEELARLARPESEDDAADSPAPRQTAAEPDSAPQGGDADQGDITDDEFEALLDALDEEKAAKKAPSPAAPHSGSDDEITDDEFEALLDQLHGEGKHQGALPSGEPRQPQEPEPGTSREEGDSGDHITDDEFESLLDELHGRGQFRADKVAGESPGKPATGAAGKAGDDASRGKAAPEPPPAPAPESGSPARETGDKALKGKGGKDQAAVATDTTVRVDTRRLDDIMNMVGELVLIRNRLKKLSDEVEEERIQKTVASLDVVTGDLQSSVMQTRMQPIKKVFGRFPRVVRDLARSLNKEISLSMSGEDTDLDKNLVEALSDPLVHLVRNAVDHGIEAPEVREAAGKPRGGRVVLSAQQEGDHIQLVIEDDGAGMDPNVLRQKAIDKGIYDKEVADRLNDTECFNLIFAPGFSTKEQISDVSGRGVGMDVVKTKINQLNGSIGIDSVLGRGSRIVIKVPLTLAIMPTLMVKLDDQSFALPLVNVVEIFHLDLSKKNVVDGRECIVVRDRVYPLFHIKRWLIQGVQGEPEPVNAHVVIIAVGTKRVGFVVDKLVGQEEVVIKPLGQMLQGTPGMAGATITGDGRIALIIDVPSLLQHYA
ncbi:MAG: chemotaxis protein CheA [Oleiphilaceae bacterium]|nr:chemotaxis protein CheA [Oleiphilaceae bacterium]